MRPVRLEVEGFTAFRDRVTVDFDGVELFALTGATGSGKTSLLDAMVFALYGSVPRLADQRSVAPVVAQGMAEARVRLDFEVGGTAYSATRLVRLRKGKANTDEARLEQTGGAVLAGTADEVTAEVERLLGLSYRHFTRCVVLPQGEFARFLHDAPKDRQDLLVSLLDLGVYGRLATLAGQRAGAGKNAVAVLDGRLQHLAHATADAVTVAEDRVGALDGLVVELDAAVPTLVDLDQQVRAAAEEADRLRSEAARLAVVVPPTGLDDLAHVTAAARAAVEEAAAELAAGEVELAAAEARLKTAPDRVRMAAVLTDLGQRDALLERRAKGEGIVAQRTADADAAAAALEAAEQAVGAAVLARQQAEAAHRAHAVRVDLVAGQPCPVCEQPVATVPEAATPPALATTGKAVERSQRECDAARRTDQTAREQRARAEATMAHLDDELAAVEGRLAGAPDRREAEAGLAEAEAAAAGAGSARAAATEARRRHAAAADAAAAAQRTADEARSAFDAVRDEVAGLGPPARLGRDASLAAQWGVLAAWAAEESTQRAAVAKARDDIAAKLAAERQTVLRGLAQRCSDAGVTVHAGVAPRDAAVEAVAKARAALAALQRDVKLVEELTRDRAGADERRAVAAALAMHLDARHFEQWVLDEALAALASGATELLRELSSGQYSLEVDNRGGFAVLDHRNADERRSARTLSGGETFLASLALALALADRIATIAAGGAARLDSIFLDEGFGTLDPDTLDVVAAALEELGSRGRMVGVATHVSELAERLPVRFEVTKVGNAATVERIDH